MLHNVERKAVICLPKASFVLLHKTALVKKKQTQTHGE